MAATAPLFFVTEISTGIGGLNPTSLLNGGVELGIIESNTSKNLIPGLIDEAGGLHEDSVKCIDIVVKNQ